MYNNCKNILYAKEEDSITVSMFPEWIVDLKRALESII